MALYGGAAAHGRDRSCIRRAFARANAKKRMLMAFGVCLFLRATVVNLYFLLEGRQHFGKSKFKQAVINIGKNAIEAMPDGGKLVLH